MPAPNDDPVKPPSLFTFSPTIELGHILQALVMLLMVGAWAIVGYQTIQKQLDRQAFDLGMLKQQVIAQKTEINDVRDGLRQSIGETRQQLGKISDQIADLRALIAASTHDSGHH